jgi:hypothetical protein
MIDDMKGMGARGRSSYRGMATRGKRDREDTVERTFVADVVD